MTLNVQALGEGDDDKFAPKLDRLVDLVQNENAKAAQREGEGDKGDENRFDIQDDIQNDNQEELKKLSIDYQAEQNGDYDGSCTNDAPKKGEPEPEGNNEHKSRDCNLCARLCYLSIKIAQLSDVSCVGLTGDEVA